ncbi:MAG: CvpA family protein [Candidatus Atribacteria bacterium]|nr:CvpA family protein [Candidatus Atribacteria bacterium]
MNEWYSLVCIVILVLNVIRSAIRGFSKEILVLGGIVLGLFLALQFDHPLSQGFGTLFSWNSPWLLLVAFIVIFLPVVMVFSWMGVSFRRVFERLDIVWFDAVLGFFVGIIKGMLWIIIVTLFILNISFFQFLSDGILQSRFYQSFTQPVLIYVRDGVAKIPDLAFLQNFIEKGFSTEKNEVSIRHFKDF